VGCLGGERSGLDHGRLSVVSPVSAFRPLASVQHYEDGSTVHAGRSLALDHPLCWDSSTPHRR
jgi:hypothetical protein